MFKLIALDMDGTLLRPDKTISKATRAAIKNAKERGIKVVLATGRPTLGIHKYLKEPDLINEAVAEVIQKFILCKEKVS